MSFISNWITVITEHHLHRSVFYLNRVKHVFRSTVSRDFHKNVMIYFEGENSALTEYKRWLFTVPVSEAGLCVTHWASGSRFAANYILLTFSRVWWGDFLERLSLAFVWSRQGFWERCWESVHCEVAARHLQTPDEPKLQPGLLVKIKWQQKIYSADHKNQSGPWSN